MITNLQTQGAKFILQLLRPMMRNEILLAWMGIPKDKLEKFSKKIQVAENVT